MLEITKKYLTHLKVWCIQNYDRSKFVTGLPVKPSPNLPNDTAVLLYPSLGLFEGTIVSLGRGTDYPFQFISFLNEFYQNSYEIY